MSETTPTALPALEGELTIQFAAAQHQKLLALLEDTTSGLSLDLSSIEACDSSGIQLLLAARKSLAERHVPFEIHAASTAVTDVLRTYGLQHLMAAA